MKIGFFDTKEFESKDGKPSPFDDTVVKRELIVMLNAIRLVSLLSSTRAIEVLNITLPWVEFRTLSTS